MPRLKLKESLEEAGYTQVKAAKKLKISETHLREIISGKKNPSLKVTQDILRLLKSNDIRIMDKN